MDIEKIKSLFPLKAEITEEIIKNSKVGWTTECIGANTLRKALELKGVNESNTTWGAVSGGIYEDLSEVLVISTKERVNMMSITEPQAVTFEIVDYYICATKEQVEEYNKKFPNGR